MGHPSTGHGRPVGAADGLASGPSPDQRTVGACSVPACPVAIARLAVLLLGTLRGQYLMDWLLDWLASWGVGCLLLLTFVPRFGPDGISNVGDEARTRLRFADRRLRGVGVSKAAVCREWASSDCVPVSRGEMGAPLGIVSSVVYVTDGWLGLVMQWSRIGALCTLCADCLGMASEPAVFLVSSAILLMRPEGD